jgi:hypothetical protein
MSVLDDIFNYCAEIAQKNEYLFMRATLTSSSPHNLSASTAVCNGQPVYYVPAETVHRGPVIEETPATISFAVELVFLENLSQSYKSQFVTVELSKATPISRGAPYSMQVTFPWATVESAANVDSASNVVYGSQGSQFVALDLEAFTGPAPPK